MQHGRCTSQLSSQFDKDIWTPILAEILDVQQDLHNDEDNFSVSVLKAT